MKYLKKFSSATTYEEYVSGDYDKPNVSLIDETGDVEYNDAEYDYENMYLTTEAVTNGTITFTIGQYVSTGTVTSVSYSIDSGETWTTTNNVNNTQKVITVNVSAGDKVLWKGVAERMSNGSTTSSYYYSRFGGTSTFDVYGNSMSLLYSDDFADKTSFPNGIGVFNSLFYISKCRDAKNLILPSKSVGNYGYQYMFGSCSNLLSAPKVIPAMTLGVYCYYSMFFDCSKLVQAPKLPARVLASYCYYQMFSHCASLTTAPRLPATALANNCYYYMFSNCKKLTDVSPLPATALASSCYSYMFTYCSSLSSPPELPATTLADSCYERMFYHCSSLETPPLLPATTMKYRCYGSMFYGCVSLLTAPKLPATTLADSCYSYMFNSCYNIETAPKLPAMNLKSDCYAGMFKDCTGLRSVELPATTLVVYCYYQMFYQCENLQYIKCMATTFNSQYTKEWTYDVNSTGTFVGDPQTEWTTGKNGVPIGWETNVRLKELPQPSNTLWMYVDDFPDGANEDWGYDEPYSDEFAQEFYEYDTFYDYLENVLLDPETAGCNLYEYCEPFEYDGDTYYIWIYHNVLGSGDYGEGNAAYLLTDTIDKNTLVRQSLDYDYDNVNTHPIVAWFDEDLNESYDGYSRNDCIVLVGGSL